MPEKMTDISIEQLEQELDLKVSELIKYHDIYLNVENELIEDEDLYFEEISDVIDERIRIIKELGNDEIFKRSDISKEDSWNEITRYFKKEFFEYETWTSLCLEKIPSNIERIEKSALKKLENYKNDGMDFDKKGFADIVNRELMIRFDELFYTASGWIARWKPKKIYNWLEQSISIFMDIYISETEKVSDRIFELCTNEYKNKYGKDMEKIIPDIIEMQNEINKLTNLQNDINTKISNAETEKEIQNKTGLSDRIKKMLKLENKLDEPNYMIFAYKELGKIVCTHGKYAVLLKDIADEFYKNDYTQVIIKDYIAPEIKLAYDKIENYFDEKVKSIDYENEFIPYGKMSELISFSEKYYQNETILLKIPDLDRAENRTHDEEIQDYYSRQISNIRDYYDKNLSRVWDMYENVIKDKADSYINEMYMDELRSILKKWTIYYENIINIYVNNNKPLYIEMETHEQLCESKIFIKDFCEWFNDGVDSQFEIKKDSTIFIDYTMYEDERDDISIKLKKQIKTLRDEKLEQFIQSINDEEQRCLDKIKEAKENVSSWYIQVYFAKEISPVLQYLKIEYFDEWQQLIKDKMTEEDFEEYVFNLPDISEELKDKAKKMTSEKMVKLLPELNYDKEDINITNLTQEYNKRWDKDFYGRV